MRKQCVNQNSKQGQYIVICTHTETDQKQLYKISILYNNILNKCKNNVVIGFLRYRYSGVKVKAVHKFDIKYLNWYIHPVPAGVQMFGFQGKSTPFNISK